MELAPRLRPRLRGVLHQYAFFVALAAAAPLVLMARSGRAALAEGHRQLGMCRLTESAMG